MKLNNKICVVGAGYWGKNHIRTLNELNSLGGVVDSNIEALNKIKNKYSNVSTYLNLEDAIDKGGFEAFSVATPAETHFEISKRIIESKKHVLVEKPLTLDIREAELLVNLAKKKSVNLMVGHLLLFHPAIRKIKDLINDGRIGKLQYIYSNRLNLGQVRSEENVFWSFAPHDISIFQYLTDSFPISINAYGSSFLQKGIYDSTITQLKYPDNIDGHIFVSWLHPFKEHRLVVIGSDSMITFEDSSKGSILKLYSKKFTFENGIPEKVDGPVKFIDYDAKMPLTEELSYFMKCIKENKKPKIANGEHALQVIKVLINASDKLNNEK